MTLTNTTKLETSEYLILGAEAAAAETAEGTFGSDNVAEALALTEGYSELGDWVYSATAEGRTGEVAVSGIDLDGEPGLIYSGPSGAAVRVALNNWDISEGTIAPEATDSVVLALFQNNTIVAFADEGYTQELDTETAVEFNLDTYVSLTENDVLRVGLVGGGEEVSDWDVAALGNVIIT